MHWIKIKKGLAGIDLDQGGENFKINNWLKSKNHSSKLDLSQEIKI